MAFDPEMDKVLRKWENKETGLIVSINRYGEGEAKLQIGPRVFQKKDGSERQGKAGRLNVEDVLWLYEIIDEVKEALTEMNHPEG